MSAFRSDSSQDESDEGDANYWLNGFRGIRAPSLKGSMSTSLGFPEPHDQNLVMFILWLMPVGPCRKNISLTESCKRCMKWGNGITKVIVLDSEAVLHPTSA
jgi:hypothetical protein